MAENSAIEWCDHTFNAWEGCQKVSPGCDHCYAETRNARFAGGTPVNWGPGAPRRRTSDGTWRKPHVWNKQPYWQCPCGWRGTEREMHSRDDGFGACIACPRCQRGAFTSTRARVFCASLSDWLDNAAPVEWRRDLLRVIFQTSHLDWLLLSKRIGNLSRMLNEVRRLVDFQTERGFWLWLKAWENGEEAPHNVWVGATITSRDEMLRDGPKLKAVTAKVLFWSAEPLLGDLGIIPGHLMPDWVIVGGESGAHARPMSPQWAQSVRDQCARAGVHYMFKQWGEWIPMLGQAEGIPVRKTTTTPDGWVAGWAGKKAAGRKLDGVEHNAVPALALAM